MALLSLLGMIAQGPAPWVQAGPGHDLALPLLAARPTIDGRIGDDEWRGAVSLFGFRELNTGQFLAPQPQVLLGRDAEALYLAARLPKPAGAALKQAVTAHDGQLWDDDAVELFIDPHGGDGRYYQFIVNAAGVTWESVAHDASFSAEWEARTGVADDAWTAEVRVPLAALGVAAPAEGAVWGFNVGWDRQTPSPALLSWSPVTKGFHQPEAFRQVTFLHGAAPFTIAGVTDPQGGWLGLKVQCEAPQGETATAALTVAQLGGAKNVQTGTASLDPGERRPVGVRIDLPMKDGAPVAGDYEARLALTAGAVTCTDITVPFTIRPKLEIALRKCFLEDSKVIVQVSTPGVQLPEGQGVLQVQLLTAEGQVAKDVVAALPAQGKSAEVTLPMAGLASGQYAVRAVATDANGAEVGRASTPFELPAKPAWLGSKEGLTDKVLPPWTPVKVDGRTVSVWGRTYEFEGMPLPSAVTTAGASVLAGPIRLVAQADGVAQEWGSPKASVTERKPSAATIRTETSSQSLRLAGSVRVEYDGVLRSDFAVEPLGAATLDSLVLEVPVKADNAKYLYHFPGQWGSSYNAGALPKDGFEAPFRPYIWLGDDDRGVAWFSESDQGFTPSQAKDVTSIRREGEQVILRVRIIGEPVKLTAPLKLTFGMEATPVKPLKPDVWDYRICHHGNYGIEDQVASFSAPAIYPAEGNIDLKQGTFEAWVRPQFDPQPDVDPNDPGRGKFNRSLFDVVLPGDSQIGFYWNIDDRGMRAYYKQGTEYPLLLTSSPKWQKGEWHHVALTWGDETAIWLDGQKVASRAYKGTLDKPLAGATIQLGLTICEFDVDEMRISDVPRTSFDLTQPPSADEHTLLLDRFNNDFTPDSKRKTAPEKGSAGVPGTGTGFVEGKFGRALTLYGAGRPMSILDRLAELGVRTICFHEHWTDIQDYATTTYTAELRKLVAACHAKGVKLLLYFGYEMSNIAPEWDLYSDECLVYPRAGGYPRQPEQIAYIVCYDSPWQDYPVDGIAKLIDEFDIDGVYLDGTEYPWACANQLHGCGYMRPDGSLAQTYPIFAYRDILRRIYTVVKTRKPDGQVNVHNSTCMVMPSLGWATSSWDGEQFGGIDAGPFAMEVLPLDAFRCEFMGRQWGVPAELLCYNRPYTYHQAMSFSLLHDVLVRGSLGGSLELESKLWHAMDDFGRDQATFIPYWGAAGRFRTNADPVKVSGYSRGAKGIMLVISNLGKDPTQARVELDRKALGLPAGVTLTATDVVDDKEVPIEGDALAFPLDSLDFKVVRVTLGR
jgi:hypothetical protein